MRKTLIASDPRVRRLLLISGLIGLAAASCARAEGRLDLVYFHDEAKSQLVLRDIALNGAGAGIAVGTLKIDGNRNKPAALVTTDSGRTWTETSLPSHGFWVSMNRRSAWFGDGRNVWHSEDLGKHWSKQGGLEFIARVAFVNEERGWAVGARKAFWQTSDGGKHWSKVEAGDQTETSRDNTTYNCIAFADEKNGFVTGYSRPRRASRLPDWAAPEDRPRELPSVTISFETHDGGNTWKPSTVSLFGSITRLAMTRSGRGLALIEFAGEFPYASEVYGLDIRAGKLERVFRRADRSVTGVAMSPGSGWVVAVEPPGKLLRTPIPGKLKLLRSTDLKEWTEVETDYRAVAGRAAAAWSGGRLWVATDTGMILSAPAE